MAKPINKFFRAVIADVRYYEDTDQTRVVIKITHAEIKGDLNQNLMAPECRLVEPIVAAFRLPGADALKTYASWFYDTLPAHQEVPIFEGGVIYFNALDVGEGRSQWWGEPMRVLIGFLPETLSFQVRRKRVALTFAQPDRQVSVQFEEEVSDLCPNLVALITEETADPSRVEAGALIQEDVLV